MDGGGAAGTRLAPPRPDLPILLNGGWTIKLQNTSIVVIGGYSGIGAAVVARARSEGANVIPAGRPKQIRATDEQGRSVDILDEVSVSALFADVGEVDHVVLTASRVQQGPVKELATESAIASANSKLWGAYRVLRAARVRAGGSITLVSGFLSRWPQKGAAALSAINAGLEALGRAAALELAPVRVNVVSPGPVDTPLWDDMPVEERTRMFDAIAGRLPARRMGAADDIAGLIVEAARNPYLTGSVLDIDGGAALVGLGAGRT